MTAGSSRAVDFVNLVLVAYVMCEIYAFDLESIQCKQPLDNDTVRVVVARCHEFLITAVFPWGTMYQMYAVSREGQLYKV